MSDRMMGRPAYLHEVSKTNEKDQEIERLKSEIADLKKDAEIERLKEELESMGPKPRSGSGLAELRYYKRDGAHQPPAKDAHGNYIGIDGQLYVYDSEGKLIPITSSTETPTNDVEG